MKNSTIKCVFMAAGISMSLYCCHNIWKNELTLTTETSCTITGALVAVW